MGSHSQPTMLLRPLTWVATKGGRGLATQGRRSLASLGRRSFATKVSPEVTAFLETSTTKVINGEKAARLFSDQEYEARLARLRSLMESRECEACVFTSIHNTAYFSNYVYCSMGRPYGLVAGRSGSATTIASLVDGGHPLRKSYGDALLYTDWKKDNYIRAIKEALGDVKGNIGVEFDHMNLQTHIKLAAALPHCTLVDVSPEVSNMRMVKSREELEVTKLGAMIADIGGAAVWKACKEGAQEWEIASEGVKAMKAAIAEKAGHRSELLDTWIWFNSGQLNTDGAHNPTTTRSLKKGDLLLINCFPMIQGYYAALERTFFLGHVDDASLRYWEANVEVHKRGLELIKPGVKCSEVADELNELVLSQGMLNLRSFGYGHSFGLVSYYYGREAGLELREDVHTVIEPGMVVSMEPMVTVPYGQPGAGGYREHDILVIEEDGTVENITKFPLGPEHNVIPC